MPTQFGRSYTYHLPPPSCSRRVMQKKKKPSSSRKLFENFPEKVKRVDHYQKNDQTERAKGLGRKNERDRKGE